MLVSAADGDPDWSTEPITLAPGDSGLAQITVTPTGFGQWSRVFTLETNAPRQSKLRLVLTADIKPRLDVEPRVVDLGRLPAGSDTCAVVRLRPLRDETLEIAEVAVDAGAAGRVEPGSAAGGRAEPPALDASYARDPDDASAWLVTLCLRPERGPGPLGAAVRVRASNPELPEVEIFVKGTLTGGLSYPERVELESPFEGLGDETTVPLRRLSGPPFHVVAAAVNDPHLRAEVQTVEEGEAYDILLTLLPDMPGGVHSALLRVTTDRADLPEVAVVVQVRMGRQGRGGRER